MKQIKLLAVGSLILVALITSCEAPYSNPPTTFQDLDLVGTWKAHYMEWGIDQLVFREDRKFKQIYRDNLMKGYVYETPWNKWWVERLPDGRVRVHLQGARYYLAGIERAERDGWGDPCPKELPDCGWDRIPYLYYDPFGKESVDMVGKLILNVRVDFSGEILLHHMWTSSGRGFAIIGGEAEEFRRIKTP